MQPVWAVYGKSPCAHHARGRGEFIGPFPQKGADGDTSSRDFNSISQPQACTAVVHFAGFAGFGRGAANFDALWPHIARIFLGAGRGVEGARSQSCAQTIPQGSGLSLEPLRPISASGCASSTLTRSLGREGSRPIPTEKLRPRLMQVLLERLLTALEQASIKAARAASNRAWLCLPAFQLPIALQGACSCYFPTCVPSTIECSRFWRFAVCCNTTPLPELKPAFALSSLVCQAAVAQENTKQTKSFPGILISCFRPQPIAIQSQL